MPRPVKPTTEELFQIIQGSQTSMESARRIVDRCGISFRTAYSWLKALRAEAKDDFRMEYRDALDDLAENIHQTLTDPNVSAREKRAARQDLVKLLALGLRVEGHIKEHIILTPQTLPLLDNQKLIDQLNEDPTPELAVKE